MKFILALTLILPTLAFAEFKGSYTMKKGECTQYNTDYLRASIRPEAGTLWISIYAKDASGLTIDTKSSRVLNDNFAHGNPIKYIITKATQAGSTLSNTVTYEDGSGRKELVERRSITKTGNKVVYQESNLKDKTKFKCTMTEKVKK